MKRIAGDVDVLDVTHGIPPRDVRAGALALANALPYLPVGVHVAVVDPGVGSERRGVAIETGDGRVHVGPDNGLLLFGAERLSGIARAVELVNDEFFLSPVSRTFHGRDVFCSVAAHVASGVPLERLGPRVAADDLRRLEIPSAELEGPGIRATVIGVDRFGNVQLNVREAALGRSIDVAGRAIRVGGTFADVPEGELVVFEDSFGWLAIAENGGSASETLGLGRGDPVTLSW